MKRISAVFVMLSLLVLAAAVSAAQPSRVADKGCVWEKFSDPKLGLDAWVERCDYGFRKIDFVAKGSSLAMRFSDGGDPDPVIDVIDLQAGETAEAGLKRIFAARTPAAVARRCVLATSAHIAPPAGVRRFTFVPNAAYQKELDRKADPNEVPDPPCGEWGDAPDGIQYFEVQNDARAILFVRAGQDIPLFDEQTLRVTKRKP